MTPMELLALARQTLSYDKDAGVFLRIASTNKWRPGEIAGSPRDGYIRISIRRRLYSAHRLAWLFVHERWPEGEIDHINGKRDDNRICNLREVSRSVNTENQRRAQATNKSSGLLGCSNDRGRWKAQIGVRGQKFYLGMFSTREEAHAAYVAAKRKLHEGCTI